MSAFAGKQYPGAMRDHRARKRATAEERRTRDDRTCPIFPDECAECRLCVEVGFCECHDCYVCGELTCDGHRESA